MTKLKVDPTLLWLKFSGKNLVPINDLGLTLEALLQIIYKYFLFEIDRLTPAGRLNKKERDNLALQSASWEKGSDIFGLIPLFQDLQWEEHFISISLSKAIRYISSGKLLRN